ncbi:DUF805 domain-containing protein [Simkania negevensis]|uniref:Inner membrane protein yhaI n=1 Tax=Simkania negevensis (strain ATCC VR-1471 / DSM 27360 / Z) TaxID=331113 RepID=F8L438_SIMNZ|nr:DUF805 domain-containing protein [Simkania negevensis]MCB1066637.1 DUF805 domain-containing protein [Simkania sp.]MCB1075543.1 DUF805 domain-containing protein [Simkania sp.]MCP5489778.1 DUF805 domain-containing protein [Chlamydiales bacterium]CCB90071.1 inner membrane protein yhaI [Simkania negevensis Z]
MKYVWSCISKNWGNFRGRARRKEYWLFFLAMIIGSIVINFLRISPFTQMLCSLLYFFVFMIPGLAVTVRRLHDIGKSGWNILFALIPLIGPIVLLVFYCRKGQEGENRYGPSPLLSSQI